MHSRNSIFIKCIAGIVKGDIEDFNNAPKQMKFDKSVSRSVSQSDSQSASLWKLMKALGKLNKLGISSSRYLLCAISAT